MLKHDRADYDAEEAMKEFEEIRKTLSVSLSHFSSSLYAKSSFVYCLGTKG
jgi:hypothetical protein